MTGETVMLHIPDDWEVFASIRNYMLSVRGLDMSARDVSTGIMATLRGMSRASAAAPILRKGREMSVGAVRAIDDIPFCPWVECASGRRHFHELAAAPLSTPYTYQCKCVEEDGENILAEHFEESRRWSRCYRPRPSCMGCGKPAVMLTDRLCAPCFDAAWDAQIDAEADRLAGPKVVATP